jgi:hypothetical protein
MQGSTQANEVEAGDKVQVHIKSNAVIGGGTQMASFTVESVTEFEIRGVDETWNDECVVDLEAGTYRDGGKSGDVASVEVMDMTDDGVIIHGSGTEVY